MSPKQQRFVEEYLIDLNATQAALRAGYSPRTATEIGSQNLRKPEIKRALTAARQELSEETQLNKEWIETRLMSVVERCMQAEPVLSREGKPTGQYRFDAAGANRALELLGRRLKIFEEEEVTLPPPPFFTTLPPAILLELAARVRVQRESENERGEPLIEEEDSLLS